MAKQVVEYEGRDYLGDGTIKGTFQSGADARVVGTF